MIVLSKILWYFQNRTVVGLLVCGGVLSGAGFAGLRREPPEPDEAPRNARNTILSDSCIPGPMRIALHWASIWGRASLAALPLRRPRQPASPQPWEDFQFWSEPLTATPCPSCCRH